MNFNIRSFNWGLANDHYAKNVYDKHAKHTILSNFINNTINQKQCNIKSVSDVK